MWKFSVQIFITFIMYKKLTSYIKKRYFDSDRSHVDANHNEMSDSIDIIFLLQFIHLFMLFHNQLNEKDVFKGKLSIINNVVMMYFRFNNFYFLFLLVSFASVIIVIDYYNYQPLLISQERHLLFFSKHNQHHILHRSY